MRRVDFTKNILRLNVHILFLLLLLCNVANILSTTTVIQPSRPTHASTILASGVAPVHSSVKVTIKLNEQKTPFLILTRTHTVVSSHVLSISHTVDLVTSSAADASSIILQPAPATASTTTSVGTTTPTAQPSPIIYKFNIVGTFNGDVGTGRTAQTSNETAIKLLKGKFDELLSSLGLVNSTVTTYNLKNGSFESYHFFDSVHQTEYTESSSIEEKLNSHTDFANIQVKEQCTSDSCGGKNNGKCIEKYQQVYCSCNLGFLGKRCSVGTPVDGIAYGPWSNWTSCGSSCEQKRYRYCFPDPINGGKCQYEPNPWIEKKLCYDCSRKDENDEYRLVAVICLGLLIIIFILLIAFCCTYKLMVPAANKRRYSRNSSAFDTTEFLRIPPAIVKMPPQKWVNYTNNGEKIKKKSHTVTQRQIPLEDFQATKGFDNPCYTNQDQEYDGNDLYRKQLALFFKQAPGMSRNGVSTSIPEGNTSSSANKKHSLFRKK